MDAEKQADMAEKQADMIIVERLRAECSKKAPRPPYALGLLMLFGVIFATAVIFY